MFVKSILLSLAVIGAQCRYVVRDVDEPTINLEELKDIFSSSSDEELPHRVLKSLYPRESFRLRRDVHGSMSTNPDGSANINAQIPLVTGESNVLSALAGVNGYKENGKYDGVTGGLALANVNGHAATLTAKHIPGFGDQLTGAAKVNLINTDNHNLNANAFVTKNMPNIPYVPDFKTQGANIDYLFKDKIGGSVGVSQTDLLKRTDYSAMGNLNLFRNPSSSLDLNAGFMKSISPYIPNRSWQPSAGLSFSKYF